MRNYREMPRYFMAQESKYDLAGNESHLYFILEKMTYDAAANQIIEDATSLTSWGPFASILTVSVATDDNFTMCNEDGSFNGAGKLFGPTGQWTIMEFTDATIAQTNEGFTGSYIFGEDGVFAQKRFFDLDTQQTKYFTKQHGYYITPEQFAIYKQDATVLPQAFQELQKRTIV